MLAFALPAAVAFNLICTSTASLPGERPRPTIVRIDLEARRFCLEDCRYSYPIVAVTDREIILQDGRAPSGNDISRRVSREGDRMLAVIRGDGLETRHESRCWPAPFTGIPRASWTLPPGGL